jgi:hypothetical protein
MNTERKRKYQNIEGGGWSYTFIKTTSATSIEKHAKLQGEVD